MEYQDYDLLLKYQIEQERRKSSYVGDPSIYEDGGELEIFPDGKDRVNGQNPKFVFATVVYLKYQDQVLLLQQQKEDRVVNTLVGLGGKVRPMIGNVSLASEKNDLEEILTSYRRGTLDADERFKIAASREVMEETCTYAVDEKKQYTHEITKEGIHIDPNRLELIGPSRVRIIKKDKTECWMILNYRYDLTEAEYRWIEENVKKENREGSLQWMTVEKAASEMSPTDQIVLENNTKDVSVSEIRDECNGQNVIHYQIQDMWNATEETKINGERCEPKKKNTKK